jgi:membrane-bound ClpP family serine protease
MTTGASLFLIALGAILTFAVDATVSGLEISTVGVILLIVGLVGLVLDLVLRSDLTRRRAVVAEPVVVRDRDPLV